MLRSTRAIRRFDSLIRNCAVLLIVAAGVLAAPEEAHARIELGATAQEAEATVGCMFPLTGRAGLYGRDSIGGIKLALADLQAQSGHKPAPKLRVIIEDDRSKASFAQRIATDYVERDKVRFLCGVISSGVAQAVNRMARERGVLFIGTDHASSRLTIEEFNRYYFRLSNDTFTSMAAGARYLADLQKKNKWKRLVYLGPDYDYGHVSWRDLKSNLDRLGVRYQVAGEYWPRLYEPDYSAYIEELANTKADIAVIGLWGGDFVSFLKQAISSGLNTKMLIANFDTGGSYDVLESLGRHAPSGLILSSRHHNNWPDTARNRKFVADFHKLEGRYPTYTAEGAYSGIMAIGHALAKAGKHASTDKLISTFENLRLSLPEDPDGFSSYIDPLTHQVMQAQAIGEVVPSGAFPPAQVMLSNWTVYPAEALRPPAELIQERRARARQASPVVQPPRKEE
ncbi:amino acid/amide ABC transporter substrate-binding protein (HAAT family) [Paucimonas lemoignei]|uniref:Amino acid/amide ABC transporter substrate-binding protein (HAAT family) n=1 Tax=Paucimonas lemoignei TaxID=29443 RepID=A0A4R3HWB0_PAULE|nr:ABC transporter substrate-binding protein [Paucimonas lemoignei]TCS37064.1 amino acid/amide ABC transporter substrate-binding protein (HAAT family) [Paucimonas lemoignei]